MIDPHSKAQVLAQPRPPVLNTVPPPHDPSRSERQLLLYAAEALAGGPLAVLGLDVAPSTLLPLYDPDTGLVLLTGKVSCGALRTAGGEGRQGPALPHPCCPCHPQGDTRVFLYELLPEAPFFLECNSFTSPDPHKVRHRGCRQLLPVQPVGLPCPLVAM